jgi:uncharacterized protein YkuJ
MKTNWTDIAVTTQKKNAVDFEREGVAHMTVLYYNKKEARLPIVILFIVYEEVYNNVNRKNFGTYSNKTKS